MMRMKSIALHPHMGTPTNGKRLSSAHPTPPLSCVALTCTRTSRAAAYGGACVLHRGTCPGMSELIPRPEPQVLCPS